MRKLTQIFLTATFLATVFGVPIVQAVLDLSEDETPQALEVFDPALASLKALFSGELGESWNQFLAGMDDERLRSFEDDLEEHSFFEQHLRPVFQFMSYATTRDLGSKAQAGRDGWTFFQPGVDYLSQADYRDLPKQQQPEGGDPIAIISDFRDQLATRGIELLVVPVPGKASIYPERLSCTARQDPGVYRNTTRFRQALQKHGIPVLDLHTALTSARAAPRPDQPALYMANDTHWSGDGVLVAASALADWIRRRPWFGELPTRPERFQRTAVPVWRFGDIPRMTRIPGVEALFPMERVICQQVLDRTSGQPVVDDPESPILLLGDSFSRVFQTDEPRSAGLIANLAFELGLPLLSIVNDGGASTLVRQQLARNLDLLRGKRLVIWEFVERDVRFGMQGWQPIALWPDGRRDELTGRKFDPNNETLTGNDGSSGGKP